MGVRCPGRQQRTRASTNSLRQTRWRAYVPCLKKRNGRRSSSVTCTRESQSLRSAKVGAAWSAPRVSVNDLKEKSGCLPSTDFGKWIAGVTFVDMARGTPSVGCRLHEIRLRQSLDAPKV